MARVHRFAVERIGFVHARPGQLTNGAWTIHLTGYTPVSDDHYVDDPGSGGRIDSNAIRAAMQHILAKQEGLFHVHQHPVCGWPHLSRMDKNEIPRLVDSFRQVGPSLPHGILLLSEDSMRAWVWLPTIAEPIEPNRLVTVGAPMEFDFLAEHD
jgi:hypothetical protein